MCVLHIYVVPYKSDAHVHLSYAIVYKVQIKRTQEHNTNS